MAKGSVMGPLVLGDAERGGDLVKVTTVWSAFARATAPVVAAERTCHAGKL
jgi:hypothetical protein